MIEALFFFAMIPLLFGIQQFFEGWMWVAIQNKEYSGVVKGT